MVIRTGGFGSDSRFVQSMGSSEQSSDLRASVDMVSSEPFPESQVSNDSVSDSKKGNSLKV